MIADQILTEPVERMRAEMRIAAEKAACSLRLSPLEQVIAVSALCAELVGKLDRAEVEHLGHLSVALSQEAGQS